MANVTEVNKLKKELQQIQEVCDTYKDDEDFTNSSNNFDIADAVSTINSAYDDAKLYEIKNYIPNFSTNDSFPAFCEKVDQAHQANNVITLCNTVGNFKYDPGYCDPGYWCGCSDPRHDRCKPSNDTDNNFWVGQYTTTESIIDPITNQSTLGKSIVYTGWASKFPDNYFKCSDTLYCSGQRGRNVLDFCPRLCKPGHYCPHPDKEITCPVGSYCMRGSTEPKECSGLQLCNVEAMSAPKADRYLIIVFVIAFVAFGFVVITYRFLNKLFPFQKKEEEGIGGGGGGGGEEGAENLVNNASDPVPGHANSTVNTSRMPMRLVRHHISAEEEEFKLLRQPSMITTPKQSFTIDVQFHNLQLTLPNGICIMQGVTGELQGGHFTAIMGPSGAGKR
ncbi:MAG: hypothetical protein ACI90V_011896 [Bacillariaceae sp.]|jgi:hypothetical protein